MNGFLYTYFGTFGMMFAYYLLSKLAYNVTKILFVYLVNKIVFVVIKRQIQNGTIKILAPTEFDLLDSEEKGH